MNKGGVGCLLWGDWEVSWERGAARQVEQRRRWRLGRLDEEGGLIVQFWRDISSDRIGILRSGCSGGVRARTYSADDPATAPAIANHISCTCPYFTARETADCGAAIYRNLPCTLVRTPCCRAADVVFAAKRLCYQLPTVLEEIGTNLTAGSR